MRGLLKLVKCELWKLKRKKFVLFVVLGACLFPIPMTALGMGGGSGGGTNFDFISGMLNMIAAPAMLPVITGILAALLFFMERDNDTLKNLCVIPVSPARLASAKLIVLLLFSVVYAVVTLLAAMVGGLIAGSELNGIWDKLWISVVTAVLYAASAFPVIIVLVWLNRSYIFSVLLTFFYTAISFMMTYMVLFITAKNQLVRTVATLLPSAVINRWQNFQLSDPADGSTYTTLWTPYFLPLWQAALYVGIIAGLSWLAITHICKRREG